MGPDAVSVAVLVDLERSEGAGGHVKTWEHLATASAGRQDLDLTLYVLGRRPHIDEVAGNVRFITLRPVIGTRRLTGVIGGVDPTDLAPYHRGLARCLPRHDLWHLTHTMAFASTAVKVAGRVSRPLTFSMQTDVPLLTGIYVRQVLQRVPGRLRSTVAVQGFPETAEHLARRRRRRIMRACDHVFTSSTRDTAEATAVVGSDHVSRFRRAVDVRLFHPSPPDREWCSAHGIPDDRYLVLFAGRVDATKGAMVLAEAVRRLLGGGAAVHLVVAGSGADEHRIRSVLGEHVSLLGRIPQRELAIVYASCDLFAFPSQTESAGNVVAEAMSAGLPVVLPSGASTTQWLDAPGADGLLVDGDDPAAWADAIGRALGDPARRTSLSVAARATAQDHHLSWGEVINEDLLPVWTTLVARSGGGSGGNR